MTPTQAVVAAARADLDAAGSPTTWAALAAVLGCAEKSVGRGVRRGDGSTAGTWLAGLNRWRAARDLPPLVLTWLPGSWAVVYDAPIHHRSPAC